MYSLKLDVAKTFETKNGALEHLPLVLSLVYNTEEKHRHRNYFHSEKGNYKETTTKMLN